MQLKTLLPAMLALSLSCPASSQQIVASRCMEVIGALGLSTEKLGKKWDASLGEVMISTFEDSNQEMTLTQGFHQPECAMILVHTPDIRAQINLQIFPNPVISQLYVQYEHPSQMVLQSRIYAVSGQLVSDWQDINNSESIDCERLSPGWYILELRDPQSGAKALSQFIKIDY